MDVANGIDLRVSPECYRIELRADLHECGREPREPLEGRVGARVLVLVEHHLSGPRILDRHQAPAEPAVLARRLRLHLRREREPVQVLAGVTLESRDEVGADSLRNLVDLLAQELVSAVDAGAVGPHGAARHALDTAPDRDLLLTRHHSHGGEVHRLKAGAAKPMEGAPGDLLGPLGEEEGVPGDVGALLSRLAHAADDDVLDVFALDSAALRDRMKRLREENLGINPAESAFTGLAPTPGSANGVENECCAHDSIVTRPPE